MNYDDYTPEELEVLETLRKRVKLFKGYDEKKIIEQFEYIRKLSRAGFIENEIKNNI